MNMDIFSPYHEIYSHDVLNYICYYIFCYKFHKHIHILQVFLLKLVFLTYEIHVNELLKFLLRQILVNMPHIYKAFLDFHLEYDWFLEIQIIYISTHFKCDIAETFLRHCWDIAETLLRHYWEIAETFLRHCWDIAKMFLRNCWDIAETLLRHFWDIAETLLRHC